MADNYNIKDAANSTIAIAADELSAGVFSPRVTPLHNGTDVSAANPLPVNATVSGNVTVQDGGNSLTVDGAVAATQSGTWNLANITGSITLPTGAATSANQTTIIGHIDGIEGLLTGISANTPALVGGKVPVDVGSITISNLTLGNVTIDNKANNPVPISDAGGSLTVDGSVGVTGNVTVQDGGNSLTVDGAVSITGALPTGSNTIGAVTISGTPSVTATISGTPSVAISGALPTGANTIGAVTISGTPNVTLTGTSNVSVTSLPALPTGSNVIGSVNVNGTPSVSISGTPAVSISGALPTGSNTIGAVTISGTPSVSVSGALPTGANTIGAVSITGALPTGANTIGAVTISGTPSVNATISGTPSVSISGTPNVSITSAIPTGSNTIGNVGITAVTPGTGATNLGKAEDAAHASGDVGVMTLAVRNDAMNSLVNANGDYAPLMVNQDGHLVIYNYDISASVSLLDAIQGRSVTIDNNIDSLTKSEDAAHSSGDKGIMSLAVRKDTAGSFANADGDYVPLQVDANGSLRVNVTASTASGGGGTQYDEDTAHTSGDKGTMALAVRKDTAAALAGTDGDYIPLIVDNAGKLWVNTGSVTIDSSSPVSVAGNLAVVSAEFTRPSDTTAYAVGDVVASSTSAAAPLQISGCARVNAGSGYIVGVELIADQKSITPAFRVHVFNAAPTQSNDNAAHRLLYADASKRVAEIVLSAMSTPSDTTNSTCSRIFDGNARIPFVCAAGTTTLWFVFETLTAFTPANGGKFTLRLLIDRN